MSLQFFFLHKKKKTESNFVTSASTRCKTHLYNFFSFILYDLRRTTGIAILTSYDINITESIDRIKHIKN